MRLGLSSPGGPTGARPPLLRRLQAGRARRLRVERDACAPQRLTTCGEPQVSRKNTDRSSVISARIVRSPRRRAAAGDRNTRASSFVTTTSAGAGSSAMPIERLWCRGSMRIRSPASGELLARFVSVRTRVAACFVMLSNGVSRHKVRRKSMTRSHGRQPGRTRPSDQSGALVQIPQIAMRSGELPDSGGVRARRCAVTAGNDATPRQRPRTTLGFGGAISGEAALRIACDAEISGIVTGSHSEILDAGGAGRTITAAQRRTIVARDQHCGSAAPAPRPGAPRRPRHRHTALRQPHRRHPVSGPGVVVAGGAK